MSNSRDSHGLVQWHGTTIIGVKKGGKTVTPAEAHAKLTMRLIPGQDPAAAQAAKRFDGEIVPIAVERARWSGATKTSETANCTKAPLHRLARGQKARW